MLTLTPTIDETGWDACESVIRRFEDAWRDRGRPEIGDFVSPQSPHSARLLVELAHVDLEFRLRAGDDARTEDYLARFPNIGPADVLDLIGGEFALRNRHRPPAYPEEFWLRFPEHMAALRERLPDPSEANVLTRPVQPPAARLPGTPAIPGYEFLGELGRGGMGVVYKARDTVLNRVVAVKTFAAVPRADACARFAREAEAIARLDHPFIVPVYTVGAWGDAAPVPYFAMKWYPGGSLDAAPSGPGTPPGDHARTVEAIARAVHHAHQRGILHRDLKPSNILLDDEGRPHVADFGLAGRLEPDGSATRTGVIVGTPAYMAPEQARTPKEVSTAADVYGLGAVLYHQLTGRPPFAGDTPLATLEMAANAAPVPPTAVNPAVPRDLETIALKCLEKDPARRYSSAEAVADDLLRWLEGRPIAARAIHPWAHAWRRVRRHPVMSALALTTAVALLGSVVVLAASYTRIRAKEAETAAAYARELAAGKSLQASLDREQQAAYLERVTSAGRLYAANQLPQAWHLLDQCPDHLRNWEWRYLDSLRRSEGVALRRHSAWISGARYLPDGRLVSGDLSGELRVWAADGRDEKALTLGRVGITSVAAHPARNWVAATLTNAAGVWDVDTGAKIASLRPGSYLAAFNPTGTLVATVDAVAIRLFTVPGWEPAGELAGFDKRVLSFAFHPDGKQLVAAAYDNAVYTWDVETTMLRRRRAVPRPLPSVAFTSDGKVLVEAHPGAVLFTDPVTGEVRDRYPRPAHESPVVATGPDPDIVALTGAENEVVLWDVRRRRAAGTYRGHPARGTSIAFGPGGKVASAGGDWVVRVWDRTRDTDVRTLAVVGRGYGSLSVSADGTRVAVAPRTLGKTGEAAARVLDAATGAEVARHAGRTDTVFHPTLPRLLTGRPDGGLSMLDAATGGEVWSCPPPQGEGGPVTVGRRIAFSPDGSRLAAWQQRNNTVRVWDAADGRFVGGLDAGGFVYAITFSPNGKRLTVATADAITVWDAATLTRCERGETGAYAVAYHPSGEWMATVDRDRSVVLRDAVSGRPVRTFLGNGMRVNAVCFSPDGTRLLTGGTDKTVRVWDVESGRELLSLPGVGEAVTDVEWGRDDRVYALDDAVRVWTP